MMDGDLSTFAIVYFETFSSRVIEVKLKNTYNITGVTIHWETFSGSFDDLQVYAEETYCGPCRYSKVCDMNCDYPVAIEGDKIYIKKQWPVENTYSSMIIYEVTVKGDKITGEGGLSKIAIVGIVVGTIFILLTALLIKLHLANKQSMRFHSELYNGYAAASSRGARFGRFEIQTKHPFKSSLTRHLQRGWDTLGARNDVHFVIKVERSTAGTKIMVRFRESGVTEEDIRESEALSNRGAVDEVPPEPMDRRARPAAQEQSHFPTAPEIMDMPPPSYQASSRLDDQREIPIPSYEEVIGNSKAYPGVKPEQGI